MDLHVIMSASLSSACSKKIKPLLRLCVRRRNNNYNNLVNAEVDHRGATQDCWTAVFPTESDFWFSAKLTWIKYSGRLF